VKKKQWAPRVSNYIQFTAADLPVPAASTHYIIYTDAPSTGCG